MKPLAPAPPNVHPDARRIPASAAVLPTGRHRLHRAAIRAGLTSSLSCIFAPGLLGMVLMVVFTLYLSSADPKANWLEQGGQRGGAALLFSGADAPPLTPPEGAVCP